MFGWQNSRDVVQTVIGSVMERMKTFGKLSGKQTHHGVPTGLPLAGYLYPVYKACRKPRAKAIIDINDSHPCRAGVKHS